MSRPKAQNTVLRGCAVPRRLMSVFALWSCSNLCRMLQAADLNKLMRMNKLAGRTLMSSYGVAWLVGWSQTRFHGGLIIANPDRYYNGDATAIELVYGVNDVGSSQNPSQLLQIQGVVGGMQTEGPDDAIWREIDVGVRDSSYGGQWGPYAVIVSTNIDSCV